MMFEVTSHNQGLAIAKLKSSLRKFYGLHHDLVDRYVIYVSQNTTCLKHFPVLSSFMTYHGFVKIKIKINTTGATSGAGTGYASESPEFTRGL